MCTKVLYNFFNETCEDSLFNLFFKNPPFHLKNRIKFQIKLIIYFSFSGSPIVCQKVAQPLRHRAF